MRTMSLPLRTNSSGQKKQMLAQEEPPIDVKLDPPLVSSYNDPSIKIFTRVNGDGKSFDQWTFSVYADCSASVS